MLGGSDCQQQRTRKEVAEKDFPYANGASLREGIMCERVSDDPVEQPQFARTSSMYVHARL